MKKEKLSKAAFRKLSFEEGADFLFSDCWLDENENDPFGLGEMPVIVNAVALTICFEGDSDILIGTKPYHIEKGDICIVLPNTILRAINQSDDFKSYIFGFSTEYLFSVNIASATPLYLYIKDNPCISITESEQNSLIRICDFLKDYDRRESCHHKKEITKHLLSVLIYEVMGIYKRGNPLQQEFFSQKQIHYFKFLELLAQNLGKHKAVDFYADALCITPRYLSAICKEMTGHTATESINKHILMNARLLLVSTNMTVAEVSDELYFCNPSFFTQFFRKHEGVSPKTYREKNRIEFTKKNVAFVDNYTKMKMDVS